MSGVLISTIAIPIVIRRSEAGGRTFQSDFFEGWRFLRDDAVLFANTVQAVFAQMAIGVMLPLSAIYADKVIKNG